MNRAVVLALVVAACGDDGSQPAVDGAVPGDSPLDDGDVPGDTSSTQAITIPFAAEIGGTEFACGRTFQNVGSPAATAVGRDFRFFVHDVKVVTATGDVAVTLDVNNFQTASGIALLDFETGSVAGCPDGSSLTHPALTGTVPIGTTYTGVKFVVGVPFARNHINASLASSPMNIPAMFWSWASGYIFFKLDTTTGSEGFSLHLGSTGCNATGTSAPTAPCTAPNVMPIELANFVPGTSVIVADVGPVVADVNVASNTPDTAQGCMAFPDDPECNTVLPKLGLAYGTFPAGTQQLFRVR